MSTNRDARGSVTGCVQFARLFQDPLLEEPPAPSAPVDLRRRSAALERAAGDLCQACPVLEQCLYAAVVEHDVTGYAAGTSRRQRAEIRGALRIRVEPEDFDTLAGVTRHHRQVDHGEVVRLRHANPHESLEQLAQRLGCSLSTVKRHLRHERQSPTIRELGARRLPSSAQVVHAYEQTTGRRLTGREAAA
jgi:AraC-like DNA-binding protein